MLLSHRVPLVPRDHVPREMHDMYDMPDADDLERLMLECVNEGVPDEFDVMPDEEIVALLNSFDPVDPAATVMHAAPEAVVNVAVTHQPKRVKTGWRSDPSDPEFETVATHADATAGGERVASDRRAAHKNPVKYTMLPDRIRNSLPPTAMVDAISMPSIELGGVEYLDTSRIANELCRDGDDAPGLSTIALSRSSLLSMVNAGMRGAYRDTAFQFPDYDAAVANLSVLVGNIVPVFGQIRTPSRDADTRRSAFASNSMPIGPEAHSFAFSPVVIATIGDTPGDQGEIVAQGVIASNKAINYAIDDDRRVSLGRNPAFEESMCLVLITHAYPAPITYASIGPCGTRKQGNEYATVIEEGRNAYDPIFLWNEFMASRRTQRGCGVSTFGFTDTKQSGKDIARQLFPWSIAHSQSVLWDFRAQDGLRRFLLETPMTMAGKRASAREDCPSGIDVRRFLLAELLLLDTPLEPLLKGEKPQFQFLAPPVFDPAWVF
jgi:hypothetical protein